MVFVVVMRRVAVTLFSTDVNVIEDSNRRLLMTLIASVKVRVTVAYTDFIHALYRPPTKRRRI